MDSVGRWLKSIVYCICILELIYQLVQNPYYQKYIRFFGGLVLMMTVVDPVLQFIRNDGFLEKNIWEEELKKQIQDMEIIKNSLSGLDSMQIENMMKNELENQVREIARECGIADVNVIVYLDGELQGIQKIELELDGENEQKTHFLELIQEIYQMPEERIEMRYVEADQ